nr:Innexin domain containing protein [Haemonchus contortus]
MWRGLLHWHSGINVQSLTQMACDARMMDADARAATVQTIAGHMEDALEIQREVTDVSGLCVSKRWGNYVTCLYVFIKMLYLGNVVLQLTFRRGSPSSEPGKIEAIHDYTTKRLNYPTEIRHLGGHHAIALKKAIYAETLAGIEFFTNLVQVQSEKANVLISVFASPQ